MSDRIQHYGWPVSPYSAKTRCYLRFKRIEFDDRTPSIFRMKGAIKKAVGQMIMPTVLKPDGTWLQDSSAIIDHLEAQTPDPTIVPAGPTQQLAARLLELHGDEWLPMVALHYRWNNPTNHAFAMNEFARYALPFVPTAVGRLLVGPVAKKMQSYLPALGVTPKTIPAITAMAQGMIEELDRHLSDHPFLLGGRPCIGDFALFGPLWAHLFRDPGTTELFDKAPNVHEWFNRILTPPRDFGSFLPDDEIPDTLNPIMQRVFQDQLPWIQTLTGAIDEWCEANPEATRVPRSLGKAEFHIGGCAEERKLATFVQWKAQRSWDVYHQASAEDQSAMSDWIARFTASNPLATDIHHPFDREAFKPVLRR